ncbi:MAG TPA: 2-oxoglutarate dehydrogenase E1 component, partial [Mariprofundaceae bacterium]|nr:2-oxoglutarate dehydrogenase E1 component [Mariprofundaceae bacterium]
HSTMLRRMQLPHRTGAAAPSPVHEAVAMPGQVEFPSRAIYLIHAYRVHGHLHADLDPLRLNPPHFSPELELSYYGLSEANLDDEFLTGDLVGAPRMRLRDILALLKETYCGHIGPEFMHITDSAPKHWLQERLERAHAKPGMDADTRQHVFSRIMQAEEFERFLHTRYAGQKRFSLEGAESLVPMMSALIQNAGSHGVKEIILGMAHRGRLNVLANVMGKSLSDIFSEFEGDRIEDANGSGDVKYHMGFSSDIRTPGGVVHLSLGFNPSHLEIITPVVLGSVRARQCRRNDSDRREVMSVLIHGDAAFAGQGVVAESLNLSKLQGFRTGGTVHIVVNNQIGFTVNPFDARSSTYCTDIAKMVQAPILHVNGDDPEAACLAIELAVEYRRRFRSDIVVDLVCYRRHGHNEADSPEVTQPVMYRRINEHPTVRQSYQQRLVGEGIVSDEQVEELVRQYRERLEEGRRDRHSPSAPNSLQGRWEGFLSDADEPDTAVAMDGLRGLVRRAHQVPEGFQLHPRVAKIFDARIEMIEGKQGVDWGCAEIMAYASLVSDGHWVRLSGQDSGRGTFFHRHAAVYDQASGKKFIPLTQLETGGLSHFIVVDSMLSELAVMAFEYGYTIAEPRALVVWEAQYGDFANNAQVVIDQFISSGTSKWNRMSGLVLWLPHGYEGQGAEHSSARLERYLQLCAEKNMMVAYPTTPAQLFHLLRRQLLIRSRRPLVIMGPKSMLRQKLSFSPVEAMAEGRFEPVLDEADAAIQPSRVKRLLLCSGKVYYDLLAARQEAKIGDVAIVRLERLYPFPNDEMKMVLARFAATTQIVWVQEEPRNQGAWFQIRHRIERCLHAGQRLSDMSRPASAAAAVGSHQRHDEEQQSLVAMALKG